MIKKIPIPDWSGNSPDINPIESIWNIMKTELGN